MNWPRYTTNEYVKWRKEVLKRDAGICQHCKCKGTVAHHIKSFTKYPELRLELSNGLTLCKKCHIETHKKQVEIEEVMCACG